MGVRAVAAGAALAVWCVSGTASAAGYAEVWSPPEASGHVTKQSGEAKSAAASKAGPKAGSKAASKAATKHAAPRVVAASGHGSKPARSAHPQTARAVAKTGVKNPALSHGKVPAASASVSAKAANATSNPATASSGSLPPILH